MKSMVLHTNKTHTVELWTVQDILDCINSPNNKIQIQPPEFQRDFVAPTEWSQNLIQSVYEGASSNLIHFRKLSDEKTEKVGFKYQCLDGLQRISSLMDFVNNKFPDLDGKFFRELSKAKKEKFLSYAFVLFVYLETMTDEERLDWMRNNKTKTILPMRDPNVEFTMDEFFRPYGVPKRKLKEDEKI